MAKAKGLTILLDEDISADLLVEFLVQKRYKVEIVEKGVKDHLLRARLAQSPLPVFFTKDRGSLKAGAVPKRHGGVVVFRAGHLGEEELIALVSDFITMLEGAKSIADTILDRRFLYTRDPIWEYARDGSSARIWPRR